MKTRENKAMRFASVLLVLTLLATSLTAGTFAKYVTSANGSAEARVAKFGVDVRVDATNVFGEKYNNTGVVTSEENNITVKADATGQNVVAPGTEGEMTFSITGNPETSVELEIDLNVTEEVMLVTGKYDNDGATVNLQNEYYPVKWTLTKEGEQEALATGKLSDIKTKLEELNETYTPGTLDDVTGRYTLSWNWEIETTGVDGVNVADTILGDLAAAGNNIDSTDITKDENPIAKENFKLNENFTLTISVEQVD